jgi:hypothetical protein
LPVPVARFTAKELIEFDQLKIVHRLTLEKISIYDSVLKMKDRIIDDQKGTIDRMNLMFNNQDAISKDLIKQIDQSNKKIRRERFHKWLAIIGGVVATSSALYFSK